METPLERIHQILGDLDEGEDEAPAPRIAPDAVAEELRQRFRRLQHEEAFQAGDLIEWKPGLRNTERPEYGVPALVLEVLETPAFFGEDIGGPYFREPLTLVIGIYSQERGEMHRFGANGARWQLFTDPGDARQGDGRCTPTEA